MDILKTQNHRSWPLPSKYWIMRQTWKNVLFAHFPISPERLRPHIPSTVEIDTYQGSAWLGVIVFVIEGIYFRGLSPISVVFKFPEVNLRTYVQHGGKRGVFFLSLDVGNWASLVISKRWYHLPYCSAEISYRKEGDTFHCHSLRKSKSDNPITFTGSFTPDLEVYFPEDGTIDHWLTERYCLYSQDNREYFIVETYTINLGPYKKRRLSLVRIHFQLLLGLTSVSQSRLFIFQKVSIHYFGTLRKYIFNSLYKRLSRCFY